jgi:hypothetical protein
MPFSIIAALLLLLGIIVVGSLSSASDRQFMFSVICGVVVSVIVGSSHWWSIGW